MLVIQTTSQFERDFKRILKSGDKDISKLKTIMSKLAKGEPLEPKHKDHKLIGNYKNRRECHVTPDWLLIYQYIDKNKILYERTGSHAELFKK